MTVREVALDRDVRSAPRLSARVSRDAVRVTRRVLSVAALIGIDVAAYLLALLAVSLVGAVARLALWPGLSWAGVVTTCLVIMLCSALGGLYGRRYSRHHVGRILVVWTIAFVASSAAMLAVDAGALGARTVAAWLVALVLALAGRLTYDSVIALRYGTEGEWPPVLLLGDLESCLRVLPSLEAMPSESRWNTRNKPSPSG